MSCWYLEQKYIEAGRSSTAAAGKRFLLDRNQAGDLSVTDETFTAERDSQLHNKGFGC
jgi:hypothetical protein